MEVDRHSEERQAEADRLFLVHEIDQCVGDTLGVCQRFRLPEASIEFLEQRVVGRVVNVRDVASPHLRDLAFEVEELADTDGE